MSLSKSEKRNLKNNIAKLEAKLNRVLGDKVPEDTPIGKRRKQELFQLQTMKDRLKGE